MKAILRKRTSKSLGNRFLFGFQPRLSVQSRVIDDTNCQSRMFYFDLTEQKASMGLSLIMLTFYRLVSKMLWSVFRS
jgi:hypothetical protein